RRRKRRGPQSRGFTWADIAEKSSRLKGVLWARDTCVNRGSAGLRQAARGPTEVGTSGPPERFTPRSAPRPAPAQGPLMAQKPKIQDVPPAPDAELAISTEKVCFIIVKAREFDVKDAVTEPDPGSNAADDGEVAVLEDHSDDPVQQELTAFINALAEDEQIDLVALAWLGRDDYEASDWAPVRHQAARA